MRAPGDRRRVVGVLRRQRHHAVVLDREHLHRVQVDDRDHVLDRPGVAVVVRARVRTQVSARDEPAAFVLGKPKLPADHGSTMHRSKSVTPRLRIAACQSGLALHAASHSSELVEHDGRLRRRARAPRTTTVCAG